MLARKLAGRIKRRLFPPPKYPLNPAWTRLEERLAQSQTIVDLGCGNCPVKGATAAVELYLDTRERIYGGGTDLDVDAFRERGIELVNSSMDSRLPFADKQFDFAYSHAAFEHVDDPATACSEMIRIARAGAVIAPSVLGEFIFGRPYHKWMLWHRGAKLYFFRMRDFEKTPFGIPPAWDDKKKRYVVDENTNPFDILLNCDGWYRGLERMPRLARKLRQLYYSHSPLTQTVFIWEGGFEYEVVE